MDARHLCIDERLKTDACIYCFGEANTRDHVPPKVFLDEPYPSQLPVLDACEVCNIGSSLDEQYLSCFLECVLCGSSEPDRLQRPKIKRILSENANLRQRIQASMKQGGENSLLWEPETSRVRKVILKLATGHAAYELFTQSERPDHIEFSPLLALSEQQRADFESSPWGEFAPWPEIGSRAFARACGAKADEFAQVRDWVVVQPGRYRYSVNETGGVLVRIVLSEYLACVTQWD
jgi:hypothetical protein